MPVTAANYNDVLELSDDPSLDESTRARMKADLTEYENARQVGGAMQQLSPRMLTSGDAMEAGGMHKPMSKEDWARQYQLRKNVGESGISRDIARQIDEGMTQAFLEDDPEGDPAASVINWNQAPKVKELQEIFFAENMRQVPGNPEFLAKLAESWEYTPPKPGDSDVVMTESDPTGESLKRIDEAREADRKKMGLDELIEGAPSASQLKSLYAPPEFIPQGISFMEAATAGYFEEPPLDLAKQALRQQLGPAADHLTEDSDQYRRFADALWKETYEQAEAAGRPVVRIKYMNTDDWIGQVAQLSARALGTALPIASGVDKSLTGGAATTALAGALDKATGDRAGIRRAMIESEERHPLATAGGAVVGALTPGGLVGRTYSGVASGIAKPGAGLAARLAGAGAGSMAATGVASVAPDVVQNLGEAAFADNPRYIQPGDIAERGAAAAALGLPFGVGGELLGTLAGKGVAALREARRGKALADLEQAGMSTGGLSGVRRSAALKDVSRRAAREQRFPEDVMADDVVDDLSALSRKRLEQSGVETSASNPLRERDRAAVLGFRGKPGREALDESLLSRAEDAGVMEELLLIRGAKAAEEIEEAALPRSVLGSQGTLSAYAGDPAEVLALRADPLMRALSRREPVPGKVTGSLRAADISEDLLNFLHRMVGGKRKVSRDPILSGSDVVSITGPMNPIEDIARGARGLGSARQLGAAGGAGASKSRRKYTISDLSDAEQQMLMRLVDLVSKGERKQASGE